MATFSEDFTGTDGNNLANGWSDDSGLGGPGIDIKYASNRGSTLNNTGTHAALKLHGLTVTGNWQIDFDIYVSLDVGGGGSDVWLVNGATFQGWGVFVGNAVHIRKIASGGGTTNLSNVGRPNEGTGGNQQNHITMTNRGSDGFKQIFLDGNAWGSATDNAWVAGNTAYIALDDNDSPTTEAWIDNLVVSDGVTSFTLDPPVLTTPHQRNVYRM